MQKVGILFEGEFSDDIFNNVYRGYIMQFLDAKFMLVMEYKPTWSRVIVNWLLFWLAQQKIGTTNGIDRLTIVSNVRKDKIRDLEIHIVDIELIDCPNIAEYLGKTCNYLITRTGII